MKAILFDVDGVFLSEERCFDVSAITVAELLSSPDFLNCDIDIHFDLSLIHISEPTRQCCTSRMPSSA